MSLLLLSNCVLVVIKGCTCDWSASFRIGDCCLTSSFRDCDIVKPDSETTSTGNWKTCVEEHKTLTFFKVKQAYQKHKASSFNDLNTDGE